MTIFGNMQYRIKRIYDEIEQEDGFRVLVDGVWPRGMSKKQADIDLWLKDIAPSKELRQWFGHDPDKWQDFRKQYLDELKQNREKIRQLLDTAGNRNITLLFSARDREHNQAVVIREYLRRLKKNA